MKDGVLWFTLSNLKYYNATELLLQFIDQHGSINTARQINYNA